MLSDQGAYQAARLEASMCGSHELRKTERELRGMACNQESLGQARSLVWLAARDELTSRGVRLPKMGQAPGQRRWWEVWKRR